MSLDLGPTSIRTFAGYAGPIDDPSEGSLANSGDEQVQPEAVPATSQDPVLGPDLFSNFASHGFPVLP